MCLYSCMISKIFAHCNLLVLGPSLIKLGATVLLNRHLTLTIKVHPRISWGVLKIPTSGSVSRPVDTSISGGESQASTFFKVPWVIQIFLGKLKLFCVHRDLFKVKDHGTSLVVQWLSIYASLSILNSCSNLPRAWSYAFLWFPLLISASPSKGHCLWLWWTPWLGHSPWSPCFLDLLLLPSWTQRQPLPPCARWWHGCCLIAVEGKYVY